MFASTNLYLLKTTISSLIVRFRLQLNPIQLAWASQDWVVQPQPGFQANYYTSHWEHLQKAEAIQIQYRGFQHFTAKGQSTWRTIVFNGKLLYHVLCGRMYELYWAPHVLTVLKAIYTHGQWTLVAPQRGGRGGHIINSCDISLENMPTSHAVSLVQDVYTCSDSAMPLLVMHLLMQ